MASCRQSMRNMQSNDHATQPAHALARVCFRPGYGTLIDRIKLSPKGPRPGRMPRAAGRRKYDA
jgi:hypothetical protein